MRKLQSMKSLKAKAWKAFSEHIRSQNIDHLGFTNCYTCSKRIHWKQEAQAGHAIPGRTNAVLFDPEIVRPQCPRCNVWNRGMYHIFTTKLIKENGLDWWEEKLRASRMPLKLSRIALESIITRYTPD